MSGARGRGEILQAATREFADHGYDGATTAGIARRARVSQPLVHHHFGSKRGLWAAVLEELFADLEAELAATLVARRGAARPQRLRALLRALVRFSGRRPELSRLIRTESSAGGAAFDLLYARWLERWVLFVTRELRAAVRAGQARPLEPRFAYFAVVGAATALFAEPVAARRAPLPPRLTLLPFRAINAPNGGGIGCGCSSSAARATSAPPACGCASRAGWRSLSSTAAAGRWTWRASWRCRPTRATRRPSRARSAA